MEEGQITTQSVGKNFVEVNEEFLVNETNRTKIILKAGISNQGVKVDIIRYRKGGNGELTKIIPVNFNSLHENDSIKLVLDTKSTNQLHLHLNKLQQLAAEQGVKYGTKKYKIADAEALVINDKNKQDIIQQILDKDITQEVWNKFIQSNPEDASRLAQLKIHDDRKKALDVFESMLNNSELKENDWQRFFEINNWIFGYGLRYQILKNEQAQPNYNGANVTGSGGQRGDYLVSTEAEVKFTCLVEIKKPTTNLLQSQQYRNGAWGVSKELAGAVSQIQVNCAQWEIEAKTERNREKLDAVTISPKGIVVVGRTSELIDFDRKNSFERFRRNINNPEIITFDELYERAKFILG